MNKKIGLFLTLFVVLSISVFAQGQKNDMMRNQADIDHQIEGGEMED